MYNKVGEKMNKDDEMEIRRSWTMQRTGSASS